MRFDHHLHTSRHSPDSVIDPLELIERAPRVGLQGVVITEHDHQWAPDELADLASRAGDLRVFSGAEISAREGHFLVYGLPSLADVEPGIRVADLLKVVRGHKAAIVAAHPFRWGQPFDAIVAENGPAFDAIELVSNNVTDETRSLAERLIGRTPMRATGSSDAHEIDVVGCYFTEFSTPIRSMADFVSALQAGGFRPGHRRGIRLSCGPAD
ncbi:PHP domain protein [Aquisphaera giovannonii]|uniref:PHP domain protein n=1 Tax=Aquisphaera giovannonii TaxID=406548 RepID=A0A5B9W7Y7_9BACT|nr:PHP domain-containing protein [Aquisphaera giovannonii]QEH36698.1 PHP domain protein [Aquisphaera giovannonii]